MRPKVIARKYVKTWLLIDVVSCLPTAYVTQIIDATRSAEATSTAPNTKIFKILRLLRLAKLLRLARLKKIIKRHEEEFENLMGLAKVLVAGTHNAAMSTLETYAPLVSPFLQY